MNDELSQALARIPALDPARLRLEPLDGGITNRNYRLEQGGEVFVLRLGGDNTDLLGIDRHQERHASAWAAEAGLGADLMFADADANLLLTRFIEGPALTPQEAARPETLARVAEVLRAVHGGPPLAGRFSPFEVVRSYGSQARQRGVQFPPEIDEVMQRMEALERRLGPGEACLCHNDMLGANFIHDGKRWRLIDWEYAAMGDPFFDLGNFAVNQELDEQACAQLLQAYFGRCRDEDLTRLRLMRLASDLREAFWGFLQSGISSLDFDFIGYGQRHLQRFLRSFEGELQRT